MRLIHTSDWHLGQLFYQHDRTAEHEAFLGWLLETLGNERADALLVAGDIFDHANPSAADLKALYRFVAEARRRYPKLAIVLVAGNHDSPGRLEAPSPLLEAFDVTVIGQVTRRDDGTLDVGRLCVPLRDGEGRVAAWCLAIPFLRSADVSGIAPNAYASGVAGLHRAVLDEVLRRSEGRQAIVALTHCHLEGAVVSAESERPIVVGGVDALSRQVFDPRLTYVALGHLHRPQTVRGEERLRYSGSPLPLSFSEADYRHQVVRVDLDGDRVADIQEILVPRIVDLLRLPLEAAAVDDVLARLRGLELPVVEDSLRPYLEVRVRLDGPEPALRARVDDALADKPVRLARIETEYSSPQSIHSIAPVASLEDLARLTPQDVFMQRHRALFGTDVSDELLAAFGDLLRGRSAEEAR